MGGIYMCVYIYIYTYVCVNKSNSLLKSMYHVYTVYTPMNYTPWNPIYSHHYDFIITFEWPPPIGILSDTYSDIIYGILADIYSDILSGILSGKYIVTFHLAFCLAFCVAFYWYIYIYSDILFGILCDVYSDFYPALFVAFYLTSDILRC